MAFAWNTVFGVNLGFQFFGEEEASAVIGEEATGGVIISIFCVHLFFIKLA